ncbi:MAG: prepilin-type N-terminal cleavage/methylation domain-containing protein [bacterium]|nr:prepilin-type N-terminal cleavage/methylation domain-containing protein [bacterium]
MKIKSRGFTLIELLVVIAIIGLLSSVVFASLNGTRTKARDAFRLSSLRQVQNALELYASDNNGLYPSTGSMNNVFMDPGCSPPTGSGEQITANWVPELTPTYISKLPVDPRPTDAVGKGNILSCFMYSSDGKHYLLSAWDTVETGPQTNRMYSIFGFREPGFNVQNALCIYNLYYFLSTGFYPIDAYSYTLTNMTASDMGDCGNAS